jgi:hypothetical protein
MLAPEDDLADRWPVWDALQMLYMDIPPEDEMPWIAQTVAKSKYALDELEVIFFNEVFPACRANLMHSIPEWQGFAREELITEILKKQWHGKRRLFLWRKESERMWADLKLLIQSAREGCA